MAELIAKRYADALFEVSQELNKIEPIQNELQFISSCLNDYPEVDLLLKSPLIQLQEKKDILTQVFNQQISKEVMNFLFVLLDKRRQGYIKAIIEEFKVMANAVRNEVEAVAYTAELMTQTDILQLQTKLSATSGKNIKLTNVVNKDIVGGVLIKLGDKVIDGTVKSRLDQMKNQLTQILV